MVTPLLAEAGLEGVLPADVLDANRGQLESMGSSTAQLEAIILMTGRPPLVVRNNAVSLSGIELPLEDFGADIDTKIKKRRTHDRLGRADRVHQSRYDLGRNGMGYRSGR